jgi:predicted Fe-Mo cluster-binding NifX family protein
MKIAIPTNDRKTIAAHTGKCREFAFFEIENGKLISEKFEENLHTHQNLYQKIYSPVSLLKDIAPTSYLISQK